MRGRGTTTTFMILAALIAVGVGCASKKPCDLTREDFDDGMRALDAGDTGTVEEVVFDKLSIYDRTLIQTARIAALDVMDLYIGEGRYMASNLFNILVDDLDAAARYGGTNR